MKNKKKLAACLALTTLLNVGASTLTACSAKEENKTTVQSETSIDATDIIVVDTLNENVEKVGIKERYLILYRVGTSESAELSTNDRKAVQYEYKDIMNKEYVGVVTEYKSRLTGKVKETIFAYANMYYTDIQTVAIVKPTKDLSWYNNLNNILYSNFQKDAYEMYELKEIYQILNKEYLNENNNDYEKEDEVKMSELKYTYEIN